MDTPTTFTPKTAIVTASDSGIGKATAVALAEAGLDGGVSWHTDSDGPKRRPVAGMLPARA